MSEEAKNEVIDITPSRAPKMSVVSKQDVNALKRQREMLREFVQSQLVEANFDTGGGEGDYGIIPGTKKRTLFKQGAEKMQRLFQLGCRFKLVDKLIEREANFAMYTYKAEIYSLKNPDVVIAECDATTNSQEVKYKERTVWEKKTVNGKQISESRKEETPIFDVLNTLIKMAQKRAMIGATLLATGASEYFTQDMLEEDDIKPPGDAPAVTSGPTPVAAAQEAAPMCCGKAMMTSKFPKSGKPEWFCMTCKTSQIKGGA